MKFSLSNLGRSLGWAPPFESIRAVARAPSVDLFVHTNGRQDLVSGPQKTEVVALALVHQASG